MYAEQITAFEQRRTTYLDRQKSIMDKANAEGRNLDAAEAEEFDTIDGDLEAIDSHLKRLTAMEKREALEAVPVKGYTPEEGTTTRGGERIIVKAQPKLAQGLEFARLAKIKTVSRLDG